MPSGLSACGPRAHTQGSRICSYLLPKAGPDRTVRSELGQVTSRHANLVLITARSRTRPVNCLCRSARRVGGVRRTDVGVNFVTYITAILGLGSQLRRYVEGPCGRLPPTPTSAQGTSASTDLSTHNTGRCACATTILAHQALGASPVGRRGAARPRTRIGRFG